MSFWVTSYERIDKGEQGLKDFVVDLVDQANSIPLDDLYETVYMALSQDVIYYKSLNTQARQVDLSLIGDSVSLLSSSKLTMSAQIDSQSEANPFFSQVIITANDGSEIVQFIIDENTIDNPENKLENSSFFFPFITCIEICLMRFCFHAIFRLDRFQIAIETRFFK